MRQAEKEKKKFYFQIPFILDADKKIPKKFKIIKNSLSDIIFGENRMRQAKKERKKFYSRMPFILDPGKKIPKKIVMKLKKLKNHFPTFFIAKMGCDRPRKIEKNFTSEFRSNSTRARKFRKKQQKN